MQRPRLHFFLTGVPVAGAWGRKNSPSRRTAKRVSRAVRTNARICPYFQEHFQTGFQGAKNMSDIFRNRSDIF